jgi:hypothetical protein
MLGRKPLSPSKEVKIIFGLSAPSTSDISDIC